MDKVFLTQPRIVVLSGRTLFAEGIAASLGQNLGEQDYQTMDAQQPEVIERLVALQPRVVIVDATDEDVTQRFPLDSLLAAMPALTILRLDPQHEQLQVVTSRQRSIRSLSDIVGVINSLDTKEDTA
jgi:hypothetical protein